MSIRRWSAALLLVLVTAACSDGGTPPEVATAATPGASSPSAAPSTPSDDPVQRELEFVACMREAGVTDMPDPVPGDRSGRSALLHAIDDLGMGLKDSFQTALDGCTKFLPPSAAQSPRPADDVEKLRQYAQCMRDNGATDVPDPDPVTGQLNHWIRQDDKAAMAALEKCRNLLPAAPTAKPNR
ncbi:hypothetical protein [Catellatospora tritici]|uniref:hypothetical protein n=1 Tax=Catellatospora tritici TaxID=2851566 RepID=UPI001C2CF580|nr:hypothetical protein [Catellatospora tritici]MBV1851815.1 hypothetical protein [Catellatospora tritici]